MAKPISEKVVSELVSPPRRHYFGGSKLAGSLAPGGFGVDVQPTGAKILLPALPARRAAVLAYGRQMDRVAKGRRAVGGRSDPCCP
jgi:hypothetical protein